MGFEGIKTDGRNRKQEKLQINDNLIKYFGYWELSYVNENKKEGQIELYNKAENEYLKKQEELFNARFKELEWDLFENGFHAENTSASIDLKNKRVILNISGRRETIGFSIKSDFKFLKSYKKKENALKAEFEKIPYSMNENIEQIVLYNEKLNGNYNFEIEKDWNFDNPNKHAEAIKQYSNMSELLEEISNKYF